MARRDIQGSRAIVTGASSGIGRELALELARQGARQVLTARREERLRQLVAEITARGQEAHYIPGDIADADVRGHVIAASQEHYGGIDILVNNAGLGGIGPFAAATPERLRRIMEVNFFAPAELIRSALPLLQKGTHPIIVNVCSVLGHRAVPSKSEYCASKFALHGFSDALRAELGQVGIDLLLVNPSTTQTEFFDNVIDKQGDLWWSEWAATPAKVVARKTLRAIRRGKHEIILTIGGKLLVWFDRLAPGLTNRLVERFG